jgi:hypothetical protein
VTGLVDLGLAIHPAADGEGRDGAETPREYFRRFLRSRATRPSDLQWYFDQALADFGQIADVQLAIEELADRLATLIGFGTVREPGDDHAVWSSDGFHLIVWVLDMPATVARLSTLSQQRDRAAQALGAASLDRVSCLIVLGGAINQRLLQDTVMLRRVQDHVRVVTAGGLMALGALIERGALGLEDARCLLRPATALADSIISVADRASTRSR